MKTFALLSFTVLALGFGCTKTETAFDCLEVCERYRSCFDASYNTEACRDRCKAGDPEDALAKADACEDCMDANSCATTTFTCQTQCAGVVP
jgi:hypothetical protein